MFVVIVEEHKIAPGSYGKERRSHGLLQELNLPAWGSLSPKSLCCRDNDVLPWSYGGAVPDSCVRHYVSNQDSDTSCASHHLHPYCLQW